MALLQKRAALTSSEDLDVSERGEGIRRPGREIEPEAVYSPADDAPWH